MLIFFYRITGLPDYYPVYLRFIYFYPIDMMAKSSRIVKVFVLVPPLPAAGSQESGVKSQEPGKMRTADNR